MKMIHVIVADDHSVMRESLRCFLDSTANITVVGEACNGYEALDLTQKLTPDVLLLDMEMPGLTGIEITQRLNAAKSPVCILILSAHDDNEYRKGALMAGAAGYLIKGVVSPDSLAEAIENITQNERSGVSHYNKPVTDLEIQIKPTVQQPV